MADQKTPAPRGTAAAIVTVLTLLVSILVALKLVPSTDEGTLDALISSTATQLVAVAGSVALAVRYVHAAIAAHKTPAPAETPAEAPK